MSEQPAAALEIRDLTVRYKSVTAVDGVALRVEPATVYALLGRNGAGKSSLVRVLLGQQRAQEGTCRLLDGDAWSARRQLMARLGVVSEDPDAPESMTFPALERFCSRLYPEWDTAAVAARRARFELPTKVPFGRLSKGQKAQVMLTLALGHRPELLVLDDPTLGIDAVARRAVYAELISELADRGTTVLITTHDLAGVEPIADRIGILHRGRLVLDEPLETLKERFRLVALRCDSEARPEEIVHDLAPLTVNTSELGTEALVASFARDRWAAVEAHPNVTGSQARPASLEEIFIALTEDPSAGGAA